MTTVTAQFTADISTQGIPLTANFTWSGATTCNSDLSSRVYYQIRKPDGSYAASGSSTLASGSAQLQCQTDTSSPIGTWTAAIQAYNNTTNCTINGATDPCILKSPELKWLQIATAPAGTAGIVTANPAGSPAWYYTTGAVVTLTAQAASGYIFSSWSGDITGSNTSIQVTMNTDLFVVANFVTTGGGAKGIIILGDTNNPTSFDPGPFTPGTGYYIADICWQNVGTAGVIHLRFYYKDPTQGWFQFQALDPNNEPPDYSMTAGQKGFSSFKVDPIPLNIPTNTVKFGVKVWGDGETEPSLPL